MLIPIVNENEEILCYKERTEVEKEDIYMVSSLWVMNEFGEILLCQRTSTKKNDPDKWACAVAGTVEKGETFEMNIVKETFEEIGVKIETPLLLHKRRVSWNHNYFSTTFFKSLPKATPFVFDEEEIQAIKWASKTEIDEWVAESPEDFTASFPTSWKLVCAKLEELGLK